MSTASEVRTALTKTPDLSIGEILEECSGDVTSSALATVLKQMLDRGEVSRSGNPGSYRYTLAADYKPGSSSGTPDWVTSAGTPPPQGCQSHEEARRYEDSSTQARSQTRAGQGQEAAADESARTGAEVARHRARPAGRAAVPRRPAGRRQRHRHQRGQRRAPGDRGRDRPTDPRHGRDVAASRLTANVCKGTP